MSKKKVLSKYVKGIFQKGKMSYKKVLNQQQQQKKKKEMKKPNIQ